jgi:predicted nucleic-acid-binding Zn-ribbon protein
MEAGMARQRYEPTRKCVKCGHGKAETKHCTGNYLCARFPFEIGDHIDRRCTNCGYVWAEDCLDAEG